VKLGLAALYTVLLFTASGWGGFAVAGVLVGGAIALSGIPVRLAVRGLKPVGLLLAFTLAVNALRWRPMAALVRIGPLAIDGPGLATGLFFVARIVLLVVGTSLLTLTTPPVELTDALARLLRPLRVARVPVDDIATMFSIALRFIPTTAEEAEKIVVAQTARGAVFDEGGPIRRARAWVPVLVPLLVNLFRRADDLAVAMESRCYTGVGRTRLHEPHLRPADWAVLAAALLVTVATAILL
jgi:energy-coupling factor transport system permease protein